MDVTSYLLGKKAGGGGEAPVLINKNVNANGTYNASSDNADGYKKVVVDVQPNLENKSVTITENTTTTINTSSGYDGMNSVSVITNVPSSGTNWSQIGYASQPQYLIDAFNFAKDIYDNAQEGEYKSYDSYSNNNVVIWFPKVRCYITTLKLSGSTVQYVPELNFRVSSPNSAIGAVNFDGCRSLKYVGKLDLSNSKVNGDYILRFAFRDCIKLEDSVHIKLPSTNNTLVDMSGCFNNCVLLESVTIENLQVVKNTQGLFNGCSKLKNITLTGSMENITMAGSMFQGCEELTTLPTIDLSNATNVSSLFYGCSKLTEIPNLDLGKGESFGELFRNCTSLTTIGIIKANACVGLSNNTINGCTALVNFGGFENLGEAYSTTRAANYSSYTLTLSGCKNLSHDSLMNVINKLYDIATKGCNRQSLVLGSTNLAKLTAEEIAIATNKGWNVS